MNAFLIVCAVLQSQPDIVQVEELGIRLTLPADVKARTDGFRLKLQGTVCEMEGPIGGALLCWPVAGGIQASVFTNAFEEALRDMRKELKEIRRLKAEALPDRSGDWLRCEVALQVEDGERRALWTVVARGSRNIILMLEAPADEWEKRRDTARHISDGLEIGKAWTCGPCGALASPSRETCAKCGEALYPPDPDLAAFSRSTEIQIVTKPTAAWHQARGLEGSVKAEIASESIVEDGCMLMAEEVRRYPPEFWRKLDLEAIVISAGLNANLQKNTSGAVIMGLTLFRHGLILVGHSDSIDPGRTRGQTIHHELFHAIDFKDDGTVEDADWSKLNPWGFDYDKTRAPDPGSSFNSFYSGFLNNYCRTGISDDKAETYGHLVVSPGGMEKRSGKDEVVAKKLRRIRDLVRAYCPEMDDAWWRGLGK